MEPIPVRDAAELASRLPPGAAADLVEWSPRFSPTDSFAHVLQQELEPSPAQVAPGIPALSDDRPVNEYFFLRWWSGKKEWVRPG